MVAVTASAGVSSMATIWWRKFVPASDGTFGLTSTATQGLERIA